MPVTKRIIVRRTATQLMGSLEERVNNPTDKTSKGRKRNAASIMETSSDSRFNRTGTAQEFIDLYKYGWKKGRDTLKNSMDNLMADKKLVISNDVAGFNVSVPDYLAGNPESMLTMDTEAGRCIDIVVPVGWNSSVDSKVLLGYIGAVLTVLQSIIDSGYRASLKIVSATNYYNQVEVIYLTDIVSDGDILDMDKIACCFHPDFYRRAEFAAEELCKDKGVEEIVASTGYGSAEQYGLEGLLKLAPELRTDTLYFPSLNVNTGSHLTVLQEAITEVKKILEG